MHPKHEPEWDLKVIASAGPPHQTHNLNDARCSTITCSGASDGLRALKEIERLNRKFEQDFNGKIYVDDSLTRPLVSFQANKTRAIYRWFKFKEGFSAGLVEHLLSKYRISKGIVLDPFAGSGTALFAATAAGVKAEGVELLPIGQEIIKARQVVDWNLTAKDLVTFERWAENRPWKQEKTAPAINELRITAGAYPTTTKKGIEQYLARLNGRSGTLQRCSFLRCCVWLSP